MDEVVFKKPVFVGEVVSFYASLLKVGNSSISIHVDVEVERQGKLLPVTHANLVFVCVDKNGRPVSVSN